MRGRNVIAMAGSSPRLRGTHIHGGTGQALRRFIPAPAGNTIIPMRGLLYRSVHPRACGEHPAGPTRRFAGAGSSPRLRGTHAAGGSRERPPRFIPAPAGNTFTAPAPPPAPPVHPRACGEHLSSRTAARSAAGSSPRLRGTLHRLSPIGSGSRFIPAPAGNTDRHVFSASAEPGSSPRLRGTRPRWRGRRRLGRFIPAPAGNTTERTAGHTPGPVHPRACGEHALRKMTPSPLAGSSPRLRGTHRAQHPHLGGLRFIPAPAGNTAATGQRLTVSPVHPRACGEHPQAATITRRMDGSSPRLRGTLFL